MLVNHDGQFKPHLFDMPKVDDRSKRKRKTRITRNMEPLCGVPPLRATANYRGNDARILPTVRSGLTEKMLKSVLKT